MILIEDVVTAITMEENVLNLKYYENIGLISNFTSAGNEILQQTIEYSLESIKYFQQAKDIDLFWAFYISNYTICLANEG